jgi:hypothetical protein
VFVIAITKNALDHVLAAHGFDKVVRSDGFVWSDRNLPPRDGAEARTLPDVRQIDGEGNCRR